MIDSFLDDYFAQKKARLDLGSADFFNNWQQDWEVLDIRLPQRSSPKAGIGNEEIAKQGGMDSAHHDSCPASQGGRCKFESLPYFDLTAQINVLRSQG